MMVADPTPPQPSPEESQSQPDAAAASAPSSKASPAAESPFIGDPGPAFAPGGAHEREGFEPPIDGGPEVAALPGWEEDSVRSILTAKGGVLHMLAGVASEDWLYTEADLASIAPPLTRILNRYPVTQAAAGTGDELAVLIGLGGYATRSYIERKAALDALANQEPVPASGVAAEPGTGPETPQEGEWTTEK